MKEFYLPYNFIPVTGKIINESVTQEKEQRPRAKYDYDSDCEQQEVAKHGSAHSAKVEARHDLWQADRHSGKMTCRLHVVAPQLSAMSIRESTLQLSINIRGGTNPLFRPIACAA